MIFNFPDVGEGIHEGVIVTWLKKVGDEIKEDEPIVEVETDKAVVEIPSPTSGKLTKIYYEVGQTAIVHTPLCDIQTANEATNNTITPTEAPTTEKTAEAADSGNVVGSLEDADSIPKSNFDPLDFSSYQAGSTPNTTNSLATNSEPKILPKIRKLATDLKVDLTKVTATGQNNTVTEQDIILASQKSTTDSTATISKESAPKFKFSLSEYGSERVEPLTTVRKAIANNMMNSFKYSAQVTHSDDLIVTALVAKREAMKPEAESKGVKLTFLSFITQAILKTLQEPDFNKLNASYDFENQNIIYHDFINLGVAVDTEHGLIVPVIKNAEKMDLWTIAESIVELAEKAKNKKVSLEDIKDSTITITNYGSIGGKYATPVLNYPNLINIGIGKFDQKVSVIDGQIHTDTVLPLSLTYDHQIIDGAEAARFVNRLQENLNS
jgi:pyruvate dehydrogenase E2 component (dihydrolipoamide acetyltransferase)